MIVKWCRTTLRLNQNAQELADDIERGRHIDECYVPDRTIALKDGQITVTGCDGSGIYAYDASKEDGRGEKLKTKCPGCRACR